MTEDKAGNLFFRSLKRNFSWILYIFLILTVVSFLARMVRPYFPDLDPKVYFGIGCVAVVILIVLRFLANRKKRTIKR